MDESPRGGGIIALRNIQTSDSDVTNLGGREDRSEVSLGCAAECGLRSFLSYRSVTIAR